MYFLVQEVLRTEIDACLKSYLSSGCNLSFRNLFWWKQKHKHEYCPISFPLHYLSGVTRLRFIVINLLDLWSFTFTFLVWTSKQLWSVKLHNLQPQDWAWLWNLILLGLKCRRKGESLCVHNPSNWTPWAPIKMSHQ